MRLFKVEHIVKAIKTNKNILLDSYDHSSTQPAVMLVYSSFRKTIYMGVGVGYLGKTIGTPSDFPYKEFPVDENTSPSQIFKEWSDLKLMVTSRNQVSNLYLETFTKYLELYRTMQKGFKQCEVIDAPHTNIELEVGYDKEEGLYLYMEYKYEGSRTIHEHTRDSVSLANKIARTVANVKSFKPSATRTLKMLEENS